MRRLASAPLVATGLFAAGICVGYWNGLLWPVATTVIRPFLRPALPETEADFLA